MADAFLDRKAEILKALAQPTRLKILELLREGERCVCEIFPEIRERQANVSKHLALMKHAGILVSRKDGLRIFYRIRDPAVLDILGGAEAILRRGVEEDRRMLSSDRPSR